MNSPYFGERLNDPDIVESSFIDNNKLPANLDPVFDKVPMEADFIRVTPLDESVVVVAPMDEKIVHAMDEKIVPPMPMGGIVTVVGSIDEKIVHVMDEKIVHEAPIDTNVALSTALLNREESEHFRTRWNEIQGKFVDEPRAAVQQADALVSEVVENITRMFASEHGTLEGQWKQGMDVSTEDLRKTLQHYRSFFNRLVV